MLVLSRKIGERLMLGTDVEIAVLQITGNRIRLGVTAPPHIPIHRTEVLPRIQKGPAGTLDHVLGVQEGQGTPMM
jgi:carbon storage regulator